MQITPHDRKSWGFSFVSLEIFRTFPILRKIFLANNDMYGYIRGTVIHSDDTGITVLAENTGIGLEILPSPSCLSLSAAGSEVAWYLHEHVTDNGKALYGFANSKEKVLFRRLLKISGVGGKTALALLGIGSESLIKAVAENDDKLLSGVPGIGKKTALKILIELK